VSADEIPNKATAGSHSHTESEVQEFLPATAGQLEQMRM